MPTYQYRCTECGHDLEAVQKFTDAALTECPSCGGPLRKIYNAVGVVFKGSGFYRTDSRKADTSGEGGSSGSNGEGKSETKEGGGSSTEKSAPGTDSTPAKTSSTPATSGSGSSTSSSSTGAKAAS